LYISIHLNQNIITTLYILKTNKNIVITLVVVHLIFFITKIILGDFFLADSYEYYRLAENIFTDFEFYSGDLFNPIEPHGYTQRPPLYGLFIIVFTFLFKSKITLLLVQNILSIYSILICYHLFSKYYKIKTYIVLLILIASVSQYVYCNYIMSEILFQFLIVTLCYLFYQLTEKKSIRYLLFFQFVVVLLFLTKPVFYLFIIPNILISIWLSKSIKRAYVYSLIPCLALILYMSWNHQRTGSFEFSSIQNKSLKDYSLKYFLTNKYDKDYANKVINDINSSAEMADSYGEKQAVTKSLISKHITDNLISYSWFHLKGSVRMFVDPGRFDLYNFFNFKNKNEVGFLNHINTGGLKGAFNYFKQQPLIIIILLPIIFLFNAAKIIGFVMYWVSHYKTTPITLWFMLLIIVYIALLTGPSGASRFFVPILPLYCMLAAIGLSSKQQQIRRV